MTTLGSTQRAGRAAVFRRVVVLMFVSLFALSGIVHATQHFDAIAASSSAQVFADAAGDLPDDGAGASVEHCHGCAVASLPLILQPPKNAPVAMRVVIAATTALVANPRPADPPPPKALV